MQRQSQVCTISVLGNPKQTSQHSSHLKTSRTGEVWLIDSVLAAEGKCKLKPVLEMRESECIDKRKDWERIIQK